MLAFALSIDDFVISNFNSGTTVTFPLYVYGVSLRGIPVQVNVLATMLFIVTAIAARLVLWQQRRAERMAAVRPEQEAEAPGPGRREVVMATEEATRCGSPTTSAGSGAPPTASPPSTTSTRSAARRRRWCRSRARPRCATRSRRRGRRSRAGARCRRSNGRGRCWRCARSCCARRDELVALVSADMGKTLDDADGEVGRGIESVESAAAIPHLLKGETLEGVAAGVDVEMVRQPVGVVAAITPFNFPAMIPLWFLPYAIACGNTFMLKPSEQDPRPAALIIEMVDSIEEIPPGVVNLVHGGRDAVTAILEDPGIDAVSFVGRAETARIVAEGAVRTGKRVQALGGAKNSLVVMPDADLEQALPAIMGSAFGAAGQRCLAGSVCVLVGDEARRAEVREALVAAASELVSGRARTRPPMSARWFPRPHARRVAEAVGRAEDGGAELLLDGRGDAGPAGTLLGPTIAVAEPGVRACPRRAVRATADPGRGRRISTRRSSSSTARATATPARSSPAPARPPATTATAPRRACSASTSASPPPSPGSPSPAGRTPCDGDLHANGTDAVDFYTRKKVVTQPLVSFSGRCGSRSALEPVRRAS